jgi:hypothetical protein
MLSEMANVAAQCLKHPTTRSLWVPELARFVCPESKEGERILASMPSDRMSRVVQSAGASRLDPQFKLVFNGAAVGTLAFVLICVGLHLYTDGSPPPALAKLIDGLLDMAKIGFGAVVGLLGSRALQAKDGVSRS